MQPSNHFRLPELIIIVHYDNSITVSVLKQAEVPSNLCMSSHSYKVLLTTTYDVTKTSSQSLH